MNARGVSIGRRFVSLTPIFLGLVVMSTKADSVTNLSQSFWTWRAAEQPFTNDDIPRLDRPANLKIDWTSATIAIRRKDLIEFESRRKALAPAASAPVAEQVDYRLLGSAIARVDWELNINLQAGLFDDSPRTREIIYSFMRLRALRRSRREACHRRVYAGAGRRLSFEDRSHGPRHSSRRSSDILEHAGSGHLLPDRQNPDHAAVG